MTQHGGRVSVSRRKKNENWRSLCKFPLEGRYGAPKLSPVIIDPSKYEWLEFSSAKKLRSDRESTKQKGVHFFLHDYIFQATYTEMPRYADMMQKYGVVCAPDFSMYSDYPDALNIYAHFKTQAVAAYWQSQGITVIPVANWVWSSSYDWCFDGVPKHSTIAISSNGVGHNKEVKRLFIQGYNAMCERLEPNNILWVGTYFEECKGDIFVVPSFSAKKWG